MSVARAVLGDIQTERLGVTYAHEHLVLDSPIIRAQYPHILLDDTATAVREVMRCHHAGVRSMVDAMPSAGRQIERLAQISRVTMVNVVAATGLHHERYYGPGHWTSRVDADELAQLFVDDIEVGIDAFDYTGPITRRTDHRAGIVKVASGGGTLSSRDTRLFEAAAIAHAATGAPVLTHCEHGRGALDQVAALTALGVPADAILLSHIDKVADLGYHTEIASTGAWSLFDQVLRQWQQDVPSTATLIVGLAERACEGRILLGTDGARRDLWAEYDGAPGLVWLAKTLPGILSGLGFSESDTAKLLVANPADALALRGGLNDPTRT